VVGRFFGDQSGFLTGHMIDYKNEMPRSTQFSSIIVLETFPLGQIKLSPLFDERKKHRESNSSSIENAVDTFQYIERLKSEGFDIGETVLRVVVYENPFAAKPLTRRIFQGPYDERWGSNEPGMIESLAIALMRRAEGRLPDWIMKRLFRLFLRFSRSGKIVKIFEGPKLREIEAALRSYRRPPLVKAGIMKDR
jgi:hypothetical protein